MVQYALDRGVRVMPEFDIPGHGAWHWAKPNLSTAGCADVLDPTNDAVYEFLTQFLGEMAGVFPDEYMFLGGDEVQPTCFNASSEQRAWLRKHNRTADGMETYFFEEVARRVLPTLPGNKTFG